MVQKFRNNLLYKIKEDYRENFFYIGQVIEFDETKNLNLVENHDGTNYHHHKRVKMYKCVQIIYIKYQYT